MCRQQQSRRSAHGATAGQCARCVLVRKGPARRAAHRRSCALHSSSSRVDRLATMRTERRARLRPFAPGLSGGQLPRLCLASGCAMQLGVHLCRAGTHKRRQTRERQPGMQRVQAVCVSQDTSFSLSGQGDRVCPGCPLTHTLTARRDSGTDQRTFWYVASRSARSEKTDDEQNTGRG
jgi:hypothetical protein